MEIKGDALEDKDEEDRIRRLVKTSRKGKEGTILPRVIEEEELEKETDEGD
jgi:hypothetical protein